MVSVDLTRPFFPWVRRSNSLPDDMLHYLVYFGSCRSWRYLSLRLDARSITAYAVVSRSKLASGCIDVRAV